MRIAAPKSLAAAPLVLLSAEKEHLCELSFFTDHDVALADLAQGKVDLLCTGYTEMARLADPHVHLLLTHCWGLSALVVSDAVSGDAGALFAQPDAELVLPFAGSPLDMQVRALLAAQKNGHRLKLRNAPLPQTLTAFQQGKITAAVLPEPMAALLEATAKGRRLADLATLWQRTFGELLTPQVGLFIARRAEEFTPFVTAFARTVERCSNPEAADVNALAQQLGFPAPIVAEALRHVIFALPTAADARRLETAYLKILDFIMR
ncbi:MAG: hypothetical protein OHK0011_26280 [Turneriella sp.]